MRTFKVDLKNVEGFEGYVVLKHLDYDTKSDILTESGLDIESNMERIKFLKTCVNTFLPKHLISVQIKSSDGQDVVSLDEMKQIPELHSFINDMVFRLLNGNVLGNAS